MINLEKAIKELEEIVSKNIVDFKFPEIKGNSVRIGKMLIRPSKKNGYIIVNIENNATVETAFSKSGAIAIALAVQKNQKIKSILYYDAVIEKHATDSRFYSHTITQSKEIDKQKAILNRFEISQQKIEWAKNALDQYIMEDIR